MGITRRKTGRLYNQGERGSIRRKDYPDLGQETKLCWIAAGPEKGGTFSIRQEDILTGTTIHRTIVELRGHGTLQFPELPGEIFDLS